MPRQFVRALARSGTLAIGFLATACQPVRQPPPTVFFHGLPVSGRLADAQAAGFKDCFNMDAIHLRCRRPRGQDRWNGTVRSGGRP